MNRTRVACILCCSYVSRLLLKRGRAVISGPLNSADQTTCACCNTPAFGTWQRWNYILLPAASYTTLQSQCVRRYWMFIFH